MEVVRSERVDLTPLLTHSFPLEKITDAYELFGIAGRWSVAGSNQARAGPCFRSIAPETKHRQEESRVRQNHLRERRSSSCNTRMSKELALENNNFRKVVFTNKHSQVVLMSILPGEDIGREVHKAVDQVLVFVKGVGQAVVGWETHDIGPGDMFAVPAGTEHDFTNTGDEVLKLFTVYSPPEHPDGVVHATKADALAHPEE